MNETAADGYPRILPAYEDGIFQSVFSRTESRLPLADMISSYIGVGLTGVTVLGNELPIKDTMAKRGVFDIRCTATDGASQFAIEMQADPMRYDSSRNEHANIRHRSVFCLANLHANQAGRGLDYSAFTKSYQITICNYSPFKEAHGLLEEFLLRNRHGLVLADAVRSVIVDLSQTKGTVEKSASDMTAAEKWSVFIAKANEPKYSDLIRKITQSKEEIAMAMEALTSISMDANERARFVSRRIWEQDMEHERVYWQKESRREGREEGLEEGRIEGREKGLAEGRLEGRLEGQLEGVEDAKRTMVIEMKKRDFSDDVIADIVKLPIEKIREME